MQTIILALAVSMAAPPHRTVLFDFEQGTKGWWGNPWGGGKCSVQPASGAKFGRSALRGSFQNARGNIVSPYLPDDIKKTDWTYVTFWFRGDGSPTRMTFAILAKGPDGREYSYSARVRPAYRDWHFYLLRVPSLYHNRGTPPFSWRHATRFVFGCYGTAWFEVDQIAVQMRTRFVPLIGKPTAGKPPANLRVEHFDDGFYYLCMDPASLPPAAHRIRARLRWPGGHTRSLSWTVPRTPSDELRLVLGSDDGPGTASLSLTISSLRGRTLFRAGYTFPCVRRRPKLRAGHWQLIPQPRSADIASSLGPDALIPTRRELWTRFLDALTAAADRGQPLEARMPATAPNPPERPNTPQSYALSLQRYELAFSAADQAGLRNAAATARQLADSALILAGQPIPPVCYIRDWPATQIRAVTMSLPTTRWGYPNDAPVDPDFFLDYLAAMVRDLKFNMVVMLVRQGMKFDRHPEISGPAAWPKSTVRRIVDTLKSWGIEVVPLVNSLGHAQWLTLPHPELKEDGDPHCMCTSHPDCRRILFDVYDEVIEVFRPRYFHIGMDEVWWKTAYLPPEKRCKRCAGKDKADIFADQVIACYRYLKNRGIQTMMWGDQLLEAHNGGPPYFTIRALPRIPKDIIICDWSAGVDPMSLMRFRAAGFSRVIKSNSLGLTVADAPLVWGNMWGCWSKMPWLVELPIGYQRYNFLRFLIAAQYSWNLYGDPFTPCVPLDEDFLRQHSLALARIALRGLRSAGQIYRWANSLRAGPPAKASPIPGDRLTIPAEKLQAPAAPEAAVLVCSLTCTPDQLKRLREDLKARTAWKGAPVATVRFHYTDGTSAEAPILFGFHLRAADSPQPPWVYAALALTDRPGWYAIPIKSPRHKPLRSIEILPTPGRGTLHLAAARAF